MARIKLGVFLTSMSLLLFELTLTRLLSVILWYHYASFAIALALFGTAGAGVVGTLEKRDEAQGPGNAKLARHALVQCAGMLLSTWVFLNVDLRPDNTFLWNFKFLAALALFALPFFFGGSIVLSVLREPGAPLATLYGCDLAGAAAACIAFVPILDRITGPGVVLICAALAAVASLALPSGSRRTRPAAVVTLLVLAGALPLAETGKLPAFRVRFGKQCDEAGILYEKWGALCRIGVFDESTYDFRTGWGLSPAYKGPRLKRLWLEQDGSAGTPMPNFSGDLSSVEEVRHDVTCAGYLYRKQPTALVIGAGGCRDVLSALACGASSVTAIELNPDIVDVVQNRFRQFTGDPYGLPQVKAVVAEGRGFVTNSPDKFDSIQISMIDSWAASAAGGYVFNESSLYTSEAFEAYLSHLKPDGTLSISRWWKGQVPLETLRLITLARGAMARRGVASLKDHVAVLRCDNVATMLLKLSAFTPAEVALLGEIARREQFDLLAPAVKTESALLEALLSSPDWKKTVSDHPMDLSAPDDDRPFFFHPFKPTTVLHLPWLSGGDDFNLKAVWMLLALVPVTGLVASICLLAPLWLSRSKPGGEPVATSAAAYFACIGAGYMLTEMAMVGRLVTVLGHPTYAISLVLAVMLLSSAAGSTALGYSRSERAPRLVFFWLVGCLAAMLGAMTLFWPGIYVWPFWIRVLLVCFNLFPAAFFMGMPFALGMSALPRTSKRAPAVAWAANGAVSVFAGISATWIAVLWGFGSVLALAIIAYMVAAVLLRNGFDAARSE